MRNPFRAILDSPNMPSRRPLVDENKQSNIEGLYVIGDLAGAPVVKLAMEQGFSVAHHIASLPDAKASDPSAYDVIVIGAGASGLNAALGLKEKGLRVVVLEKGKVANTIEDFPEGKWVYAEPDTVPPKGKLWLDGATKEDLLTRWNQIVRDNELEVKTGEGVTGIVRQRDRHFEVKTAEASYRGRRVILAIGQRGNPRKLGVPGQDRERVYHRLYSPKHYKNEDILVVGGGNSAVEAALTLAGENRVTLSYRGAEFSRLFKDNERKLNEAAQAGRITVVLNSNVKEFGDKTYTLEIGGKTEERRYDHAFVLIGAEVPTEFLKSLGIRLENEWTGNPWSALGLTAIAFGSLALFAGVHTSWGLAALAVIAGLFALGFRGNRYAWLGVSFLLCYSIYGAKLGGGAEFWPYRGWGYEFFSFFERPLSFWYTVSYTMVMTIFGIKAMQRWGFERKDRFQIWRYASLLGFQWVFFFLIPEFLFQYAVKYEWVGALAKDPVFAEQAWRSYGIVYAWPLFFYTFFGSPHQIWIVWGVILSFVIIPVLALFHGKRYCSWICGCGGLAETLGDRWRHYAPKGKASIRWEWMQMLVLVVASLITLMMVTRDAVEIFRASSVKSLEWYRLIADVWLVGIIPVTFYPFLGGKVWCRYWCPLAKMMHIASGLFSKFKIGRFAIHANDKCIACGECTLNCQVGIDVMNFALKQQTLDNTNSSCIGCGICVTVCPMDVLTFQPLEKPVLVQIETRQAA